MPRQIRTRVVMGHWSCSCGRSHIAGNVRICPNCQKERSGFTNFGKDKDAPIVTDPDQIAEAYAGRDWMCAFCGKTNRGNAAQCVDCLRDRETAIVPPETIEAQTGTTTNLGDLTTPTATPSSSVEPTYDGSSYMPPPPNPLIAAGRNAIASVPLVPTTIGLVTLVIVVLLVLTFRTHSTELRITGHSWERTVSYEELKTVQESGWSVPTGGRVLGTSQEIHHYDDVIVGYEKKTRKWTDKVVVGKDEVVCGETDLGNGYFEEKICEVDITEDVPMEEEYDDPIYDDIPVKRTWYTYEIDRWISTTPLRTAANNTSPYWPAAFESAYQFRESGRSQTYILHLKDASGKAYTYDDLDQAKWQSYEPGQRVEVEMNAFGVIRQVK